jgi:hypothetical protein
MKLIKRLIMTLVILGAIGYGVYHFGTKIAAEKIMDYYVEDLAASPAFDQVKDQINSNPELKEFIENGSNVDESVLPFTTKEEATKALISKFGVSELIDVGTSVSDGLSADEQIEILQKIEGKLTAEELLALQVLAYKELNK